MQRNPVAEGSCRRCWLRVAGGVLTAAILLAVPALAVAFGDLGVFAGPSAGVEVALPGGLSDAVSEAPKDVAGLGADATLNLNEWTFTSTNDRNRETRPPVTRPTRPTRPPVTHPTRHTRQTKSHFHNTR